MYKLEVQNPVAALQGTDARFDVAPRPDSLDGLKIGLIWNRKRGGDGVLKRVGEMLEARYEGAEARMYHGGIPTPMDVLDKAIEECDVFVGSTSD